MKMKGAKEEDVMSGNASVERALKVLQDKLEAFWRHRHHLVQACFKLFYTVLSILHTALFYLL